MKNILRKLTVASAFVLGGCAVTGAPERAYVEAKPSAQPVRNITGFTQSLNCMDDLFAQYGVNGFVITSAGIPDATGRVGGGTKDMLITAISRMSVKSKAITWVDFDQSLTDVADLQGLVGFTDDFLIPNYYIRGAITQLDQGVLDESVSGGINLPKVELGASKDQQVSVVSVDMNIGNLVTRQILPGLSAANSIVVVKRGLGGDAGATIGKAGLFFNVSLNRSEGLHQATRTLIDLSAIELMGRLTQVPYWRCLSIEQTNPEMLAEARNWFNSMSEQERTVFAQRVLSSRGFYSGLVTGVLDTSTKGAISRYQAENGLLALGRMNFDLYQDFISQDLALGQEPQVDTEVAEFAEVRQLAVALDTSKGTAPRYNVADTLDFTAETTQDSYLYCYYQDGEGTIARLFPNRFNPDPYMVGGQAVSIPGAESQFRIIFEQPGASEEVTCLASVRELGLLLPNAYKIADLTPLSVGSMAEVIEQHRQLDPEGLAVSTLSIQVSN